MMRGLRCVAIVQSAKSDQTSELVNWIRFQYVDQVVELIGPKREMRIRLDLLDDFGKALVVKRGGRTCKQHPISDRRRAAVARRIGDQSHRQVVGLRNVGENRLQIEEAVGNVVREYAVGLQVLEKQRGRFRGDQVHVYRVARECIDSQHVVRLPS